MTHVQCSNSCFYALALGSDLVSVGVFTVSTCSGLAFPLCFLLCKCPHEKKQKNKSFSCTNRSTHTCTDNTGSFSASPLFLVASSCGMMSTVTENFFFLNMLIMFLFSRLIFFLFLTHFICSFNVSSGT